MHSNELFDLDLQKLSTISYFVIIPVSYLAIEKNEENIRILLFISGQFFRSFFFTDRSMFMKNCACTLWLCLKKGASVSVKLTSKNPRLHYLGRKVKGQHKQNGINFESNLLSTILFIYNSQRVPEFNKQAVLALNRYVNCCQNLNDNKAKLWWKMNFNKRTKKLVFFLLKTVPLFLMHRNAHCFCFYKCCLRAFW